MHPHHIQYYHSEQLGLLLALEVDNVTLTAFIN